MSAFINTLSEKLIILSLLNVYFLVPITPPDVPLPASNLPPAWQPLTQSHARTHTFPLSNPTYHCHPTNSQQWYSLSIPNHLLMSSFYFPILFPFSNATKSKPKIATFCSKRCHWLSSCWWCPPSATAILWDLLWSSVNITDGPCYHTGDFSCISILHCPTFSRY